jgi:hypothetical protein
MTTRLILLAAALLCWAVPAAGQTIKSLGFNTTNGFVTYSGSNSLTFTNALQFSTNARAATRTNLGLGAFKNPDNYAELLNASGQTVLDVEDNVAVYRAIGFAGTNSTQNAADTRTNLGLGGFRKTDGDGFAEIYSGEDLRIVAGDSIQFYEGFGFGGTNATAFASESRASLGLRLPALTNTSNVTAMRALAGSTNTNEPYSGTVALTNTNVLTFSNGVLLKIQ